VELDASRSQLGEQLGVDKIVSDTETLFGELIDQARRRGRSPLRFTSGRRLLRVLWRAFSALRRLAAGFATGLAAFFFGAASSMEPRHFGEPQRQAYITSTLGGSSLSRPIS
jgi:hypothetical protein